MHFCLELTAPSRRSFFPLALPLLRVPFSSSLPPLAFSSSSLSLPCASFLRLVLVSCITSLLSSSFLLLQKVSRTPLVPPSFPFGRSYRTPGVAEIDVRCTYTSRVQRTRPSRPKEARPRRTDASCVYLALLMKMRGMKTRVSC